MEIRRCKLSEPISCNKKETIVEVSKKLRDNSVRQLVVVDNKKHPIGVIASVDIVNKVIAKGLDYKTLKVEEVMTSPVFVMDVKDWVSKSYIEMAKRNIFSCPIVEDKEFIGVLTFNEVLRYLAKNKTRRN